LSILIQIIDVKILGIHFAIATAIGTKAGVLGDPLDSPFAAAMSFMRSGS
jgi:hypothetical protein